MRFNYRLLYLLLLFFAISCGSKKKVNQEEKAPTQQQRPSVTAVPNSISEYIAMYGPTARANMQQYGIPASITLAQGILESGAGRSELTRRANNHFGIKCHDWTGERVYHDDDRRGECFRKYANPADSFRDHSLFLTQRGRYAFLFDLGKDDYRGWAKGLRQAGYATDRKYPEKLISLIERYELYRFDQEVLQGGKSVAYDNPPASRASSYTVRKGDTLYSISRRYGLSVEQLMKYNNLRGTTISIGQTLYLEPNK